MPGTILHYGAAVLCSHAGQASPADPTPRVLVSGFPVCTLATTYTITGCTDPPPNNGNGPDITATFQTSALRVFTEAIPVLLIDSQAVCASSGAPLIISATQIRAFGT